MSFNAVYARFFGENKPARSTVEVARLPKDALVEIEVRRPILTRTEERTDLLACLPPRHSDYRHHRVERSFPHLLHERGSEGFPCHIESRPAARPKA